MRLNRIPLLAASMFAAVLLAACEAPRPDVDVPAAPVAVTTADGTWDLAAVDAELRALNLDPVRDPDSISQPFLTVRGTRLAMGDSEIQVYLYADSTARSQDTSVLDPATLNPPTMVINWIMPPSLIASGNMAAILLTKDASLRERVHAALSSPASQ